MSIMIVDNDVRVLSGIKRLLETSELNLNSYCFNNAKEAISFAITQKPQIVIADIQMPGCNGLEMCRQLKKVYDPTIVIISGYDRFRYAQQAIALGALHYVLKPIKQQQFLYIITNIIKQKDFDKQKKLKQIQIMEAKFFLDIASGRLNSIAVNEYISLVGDRIQLEGMTLCLLHIGNHAFLVNMEKRQTSILFDQYPIVLTKALKDCPKLASYYEISKGYFLFLIIGIQRPFLDWINSFLILSEQNNRFVSAGISHHTKNSTKLGELYEQTVKALKLEFFNACGRIYQYNEESHPLSSQKYDLMCLHKYATHITGVMSSLCPLSYPMDEILEVFEFIEKSNFNQTDAIIFCQELLLLVSMEFMHIMEKVPTFSRSLYDKFLESSRTLVELENRFEDCIKDLYQNIQKKIKTKSDSIKIVVNNMLQNDCSSVCLDTVADKLNLHPTYLSILFKENVGINFKTYVLDFKIETAKKLLTFSDAPIYEISKKLGYINPTYFSSIFKTYVGTTPSEYRKHALG